MPKKKEGKLDAMRKSIKRQKETAKRYKAEFQGHNNKILRMQKLLKEIKHLDYKNETNMALDQGNVKKNKN